MTNLWNFLHSYRHSHCVSSPRVQKATCFIASHTGGAILIAAVLASFKLHQRGSGGGMYRTRRVAKYPADKIYVEVTLCSRNSPLVRVSRSPETFAGGSSNSSGARSMQSYSVRFQCSDAAGNSSNYAASSAGQLFCLLKRKLVPFQHKLLK